MQGSRLLVLKLIIYHFRFEQHGLGTRFATELLIDIVNATHYWPKVHSHLYYTNRAEFRDHISTIDRLYELFDCDNRYHRRLPFRNYTIEELDYYSRRLEERTQASPELLVDLHSKPVEELPRYYRTT